MVNRPDQDATPGGAADQPFDPGSQKAWMRRITEAEAQRQPYLRRWLRYRTYYIHGTDVETINNALRQGLEVVRVNRAFSITASMLPRILFRAPRASIEPRRLGDEGAAVSAELVTNYLLDEIDAESAWRAATLDAIITGWGCVKFGFDSEWGVDPEEAEKRLALGSKVAQIEEVIQTVRSFAGLAPQPPAVPPKRKNGKPNPDFNDDVIREMPWMLRVSPLDILVDPVASNFAEARWIAHRFIRPIEDARADPRYDAKQQKKLRGGTFVKSFETIFDRNGDPRFSRDIAPGATTGEVIRSITRDQSQIFEKTGGTIADQVELFEVWDKQSGKVITLERSINEPLLVVDNPFQMQGLPFEFIAFNPVPDRLWPKSDLEDIFPQNLELNDIRQLSIQWLRKIVKWVIAVQEGALDEKEKENLTGPDPFVLLTVKGQGALKDLLSNMDAGRFDAGVYQIEDRLEKDMRETVGFGAEQTGEPVEGVTATASANAAASTDIRIEDKKRQVERFAKRCVRKLMELTRQFFPAEAAIRIAGAGGSEWRTVTREELQREFDIRIDVDSATKPRDEVKRRQLAEMTDRLLAIQQATGTMFDWSELSKRILAAYGIDNAEGLVLGQMPMMPPGAEGAGGPEGMAAGQGAPAGAAPFGPQGAGPPAAAGGGRFQQALQSIIGGANGGRR